MQVVNPQGYIEEKTIVEGTPVRAPVVSTNLNESQITPQGYLEIEKEIDGVIGRIPIVSLENKDATAISQATNTALGVVKGSNANLKISVDASGEMQVNGLQEAFNDIEVGGRNYFSINTLNWEQGVYAAVDGTPVGGYGGVRTPNYIDIDNRYKHITVSVKTSDIRLVVLFYDSSNTFVTSSYLLDGGSWNDSTPRYYTIPTGVTKMRFVTTRISGGNFLVADIPDIIAKVELGNKATDWLPNPNDLVSDWNATSGLTQILNKPIVPTYEENSWNPILAARNLTTGVITPVEGAYDLRIGKYKRRGNTVYLYGNIQGSITNATALTGNAVVISNVPFSSKAYTAAAGSMQYSFGVENLSLAVGIASTPQNYLYMGRNANGTSVSLATAVWGTDFGTGFFQIRFAIEYEI